MRRSRYREEQIRGAGARLCNSRGPTTTSARIAFWATEHRRLRLPARWWDRRNESDSPQAGDNSES